MHNEQSPDMATVKRIVVCGGNGFLGSRICKSAVERGWDVTSISRSGEPIWSSVTASPDPPAWSHKVTWERADILKPRQYAPLLKNTDAVVHSMGILLEADYKGVLSGRESPLSGLSRAFSAQKLGSSSSSSNPLQTQAKTPGDDLQSQEKDGQITYELMNRDSAITLAREANREGVKCFVYISAAGGAPVLPKRYITTKREAESTIASDFPNMRSFFIRPGMLYDSSRKITLGLAAATGMGSVFNSLTGGYLAGFLGAAGVEPIPADKVALAVVEGISDVATKGPVEMSEIKQLAEKGWRKEML